MDKLTQIEAFVDVADKGSLARAALGQHITPVMLGRRIDALEKRLGVKLMHRTTRHLTLTEQGTLYLDHCRKLLADLVHAYRIPQESQLRMRGVDQDEILKLREYARSDLKPHLEAYRSAFPRAAIHLEHGFAASVILDHVLRLRPDVLVVGKHRGSSTEERVLGSVTQFLLYSCPTDLLLVP